MAPRKPAEVHDLANRSKLSEEELAARRAEEDRLRPRPIVPKKPADLSPYASEAWDLHAPELERLGLLTMLDGGGFALACETFALARYALEELRPRKADGTVDQRTRRREVVERDNAHGGMLKKHPAATVFLQAQAAYLRWCSEFGLTPAGRLGMLRVGTPGRPADAAGGADGDRDVGSFLGY